ncbi:hypothetical protein MKX03_009498 [Papaver bracteatum]|nr:hypothetical protein MKX03_009498 [Papaver bracteatum]
MGKLAQKAEISRSGFANRGTNDYIKNAVRLLVVIGIMYTAKTANAINFDLTNAINFDLTARLIQYPNPDADPKQIEVTKVVNASKTGGVCLDGTVPAIHWSKGFESGSDNWLIHLEGGGQCSSIEECAGRTTNETGSSNFMTPMGFAGILSSQKSNNPEFYNWNRVKVRYCDGAFFAGSASGENEATKAKKLFFRGQLIWDAVMTELLGLGMANAKQAFLTGCSAGGLATLLHCDSFAELFTPGKVNVKCLSDAGFFIDEKDFSGANTAESVYHDVVTLQGMEANLNKECISQLKPSPASQCLFPQNFVKNIKTPVFLVNPIYDAVQMGLFYIPPSLLKYWTWECQMDFAKCAKALTDKLQKFAGFRDSMLKALSQYQGKKDIGMFIDPCYAHCQTDTNKWHLKSPKINDKTIAEAVGDWYFNRKTVQYIDDRALGSNPTCNNKVFQSLVEEGLLH